MDIDRSTKRGARQEADSRDRHGFDTATTVIGSMDNGPKSFCRGTHRATDPATTLANIKPLLAGMGITRVANLTGLDTIGIPVVAVCRPNSRSHVVSQGKGLDLDAAKASGLMETIESYYAERILQPVLFASANEMRKQYALAVEELPRMRTAKFTDDTRILWMASRSIGNCREAWLPYELIHANFTLPHPPGAGNFICSTNGLASGNNSIEALSHGLCEVVERDAATLFSLIPDAIDRCRIDLASIDDPDCLAVIGQIEGANLAVAVWDITSDVSVATFYCQIMERENGPGLVALPAEGHGCHPDRSIALTRALTEAAQARVTAISGLRDDIGPDMYGRCDDPDVLESWRRIIKSKESGRRFEEVPSRRCDTVAADVVHVVGRLRAAGIDEVFSIELATTESSPFSVMRVVVPGLEGPLQSLCALGSRGKALALKSAQ
jgi:YcaO-like protein with predicted kinase domain